ncbi:hypothetical protein T08_6785 [Trichinella sp. T8]|nr:hypothetical protein T08_6785 [Trichinella sp. T8]
MVSASSELNKETELKDRPSESPNVLCEHNRNKQNMVAQTMSDKSSYCLNKQCVKMIRKIVITLGMMPVIIVYMLRLMLKIAYY